MMGMMGYVIKRCRKGPGDERYSIRFRDQYGLVHEKSCGLHLEDAEEKLRTTIEQVKAGTWRKEPPPNPLMGDFCAQYLERAFTELKFKTWKDYEYVNRVYISPYFVNMPLKAVSPFVVSGFLAHMSSKEVSAATRSKVFRVLKVILRDAVRQELIPYDPCAAIKGPRVPRREMEFLTPLEVRDLIDAAEGEMRPLLTLACLSGLRQGEILALTWSNVDFAKNIINVRHSWFRDVGVTSTKSPAAIRSVPICKLMKQELLDHYRECGEPASDEFVFYPGFMGDRHNLLRRGYDKAVLDSGVRRVRFHDLRHTAASLFIEGGTEIKTLQRIMGHSSITVTMDTYAHLYTNALDRAAEAMDEVMGKPDNVFRLTVGAEALETSL